MKTVEQLQAAVDELLSVCERHGVILLGTCVDEGIYGEISISEDVEGAAGWIDPESVLDNMVTKNASGFFSIGGIGRLRSNTSTEKRQTAQKETP